MYAYYEKPSEMKNMTFFIPKYLSIGIFFHSLYMYVYKTVHLLNIYS